MILEKEAYHQTRHAYRVHNYIRTKDLFRLTEALTRPNASEDVFKRGDIRLYVSPSRVSHNMLNQFLDDNDRYRKVLDPQSADIIVVDDEYTVSWGPNSTITTCYQGDRLGYNTVKGLVERKGKVYISYDTAKSIQITGKSWTLFSSQSRESDGIEFTVPEGDRWDKYKNLTQHHIPNKTLFNQTIKLVEAYKVFEEFGQFPYVMPVSQLTSIMLDNTPRLGIDEVEVLETMFKSKSAENYELAVNMIASRDYITGCHHTLYLYSKYKYKIEKTKAIKSSLGKQMISFFQVKAKISYMRYNAENIMKLKNLLKDMGVSGNIQEELTLLSIQLVAKVISDSAREFPDNFSIKAITVTHEGDDYSVTTDEISKLSKAIHNNN